MYLKHLIWINTDHHDIQKKTCIFTYYARIFRKKKTCKRVKLDSNNLGLAAWPLGFNKLSQVTSARSLAQGDATRRATVRAFDVHLSGSTAYAQVCHVFFLMVVMWFKHKLAANNMLAKRESGVRLRWNMYTYFMYSYICSIHLKLHMQTQLPWKSQECGSYLNHAWLS